MAVLGACGLEPPPRRAGAAQVAAATIDPAAGPADGQRSAGDPQAACLPVLSGELVINEVLARPAGLDIDGDGQSNHRDEAVELRLVAPQARSLDGVALTLGAQLRGHLSDGRCHPPGALLVIVGSTSAGPASGAGAEVLHLSGQLALRDDGGQLTLWGSAGKPLDALVYPPAPPARSQVRAHEADPWSPLQEHPDTPAGAPHSLGRCRDGAPPSQCWPVPVAG